MTRTHPLETLCGDATVLVEDDHRLLCAIIDGMGHGPRAHAVASRLALRARTEPRDDPLVCLEALHRAAEGTDGAAGAVLVVHKASKRLAYAGLGNTVARIFGESPRQLVSRDGTLGVRMRSVQRQSARLSVGDVAILHTDGIRSDFDVTTFPALRVASAGYVARALLDQFARQYDDAACIVLKVVP